MGGQTFFGAGIAIAAVLGAAAQGCTALAGYDGIDFENGSGSSATSGGESSGGTDPACVPSDTSAPVSNACGLFVSAATGHDDSGDGTREKPFATLGKALTKGATIYACADGSAALVETLAVDDKVTIFGGLDCKHGWGYVAGSKTLWTAAADEVPLRVNDRAIVRLRDMAIGAANATRPGGSSIVVIAAVDATVDLLRCDLAAGDARAGESPAAPDGPGKKGASGGAGNAGCLGAVAATLPGIGGQLVCGDDDVSGGAGGTGLTGSSGADGNDGNPAPGAESDGRGGKRQNGTACAAGMAGAKGADGKAGAGAKAVGTISAEGYSGRTGDDGGAGKPGQGGGGGGGARECVNDKAGPSGGGGGSGGCGGAAGKGGQAGGSSIGIVSLKAKLSLSEVKIRAGHGGKGGAGGWGQPGGAGASGGGPGGGDAEAVACAGGAGGDGGKGGRGGGGQGGHSLGIAHHGPAPAVEGAVIEVGTGAAGGDGDGASGTGVTGVAKEVQEIQ